MDKALSKKIKLFSFVTMIMVLYVHSLNYSLYDLHLSTENSYNIKIQNYFTYHVCRIAVPAFFLISGYLFSKNFELTKVSYFSKLKSRFYSLFIPFFLWISLWTLTFYLLSLMPFLSNFINKPFNFDNFQIQNIVNIYLKPVCYQFWFIRDLMILILLSPVLLFCTKKIPYLFLLSLLIGYMLLVTYEIKSYEYSTIIFFPLGFYISHIHLKINNFKNVYWIAGCIWLVSYFANHYIYVYLIPIWMALGIYFLWHLTNFILKKETSFLKTFMSWSSFSFFLFAFHEPLLVSFKKIGFAILGKSENSSLILYFLLPLMVFFTAIFVGKLTKKMVPKVYSVFVGGR